ncbi:hypothetical protein SLEP1_g17366 [Rubroshorea leprosula]|uniref:Uncharacterized protein n=1 Tax=Rubroshorea leprosula TaxID=152421 RepID=A0AAV5J332_9ROSI|nr:hypothetical protein SLEP1_g17366 [Rubroshorea leprosula]
MDECCPKVFAPAKLRASDVTRLHQKGLDGKDVEMDLIPKSYHLMLTRSLKSC